MSKDEYYNSADARLDTIVGRQQYWTMLRRIREDYLRDVDDVAGQFDIGPFEDYVLNNYGMQILYRDSKIAETPDIVDQQKYLLAVLKYGG